ncbi:hypothetical protein P154DRAFT_594145 [Amniculicola lignicola CBS 123094]|uniref:NAD dependent epimerase/dehydratase n=1 Tax=Amniculicola lignicola CBS 123094 TaxID=1392246 RepID=A0A6A5WKQ5_9PLEO|nr:hypothetical protein P154DRAFT_594145 [Amniculicola lignicola CBS 123094]
MPSSGRLIDTLPPAKREKPMEVMALGFSRTGIDSSALKIALEKLGYNVYHMSECVTRWQEKHLQLWDEALQAKLLRKGKPWTGEDIDKILQNYNAIEDIPCIMFVDELLTKYLDPKVILTTGDIDSWDVSVRQSIFKILEWRTLPYISALDPILWGPYSSILQMVVKKWTDGNVSNDKALRKTYRDHYTYIRSKVPKERLLDFQSKEGWGPLCAFLEKPVPKDELYPRVNDAKWTVKIHGFIYYLRIWHCTQKYIAAAAVLLIAIGISYWKLME